eukprot:1646786-Alexandrium_andersonii.AAC.1
MPAAISDRSRPSPFSPKVSHGPRGPLEALAPLAEGLGRAGLARGWEGPAVHATEVPSGKAGK